MAGSGRRMARGRAVCLLSTACILVRLIAPGPLLLFVTPVEDVTSSAPRVGPAAHGAPAAASAPGAAAAGSVEQPASRMGSAVAAGAVLAIAAGLGARRRATAAAPAQPQASRTACYARGGAKAPLVVIAGPPAAGKGTQCEKIKEKYGYVHISTGDILRENVKKGTELGTKAKEYMDAGALVPSELIVDLVKDRLTQDDVKEKGCLLDGFPRAPDQAQAMTDAGLKVQKFLLITVPDDTLVERGCGRRLDPETGDIYHLKFKPPPAEIVDRLVHRSDDQEDKIRARLQAYHSQIDGITPYFKDAVCEVDGTGKPDDVFSLVVAGLDDL